MPDDHELYYGFTRFAIELNEFDSDMSKYLPPTDSRFRPDQRFVLIYHFFIIVWVLSRIINELDCN